MRVLSKPQPLSIHTEFLPLDVSFDLIADDTLRQWYHNVDNLWQPNRTITPLNITPRVMVNDKETSEVSECTITQSTWSKRETVSGQTGDWSVITTTIESPSAPYQLDGDAIRVKENILNKVVELKCHVLFAHPKFEGVTYEVEDSVLLVTSEDTALTYANIYLSYTDTTQNKTFAAAELLTFDPILDYDVSSDTFDSQFTFTASAKKGDVDVTDPDPEHEIVGTYFEWYIQEKGVTVAATSHPAYVSGGTSGSKTLVVDALYSEEFLIICQGKEIGSTEFYPTYAKTTVAWSYPLVDCAVECENGASIKETDRDLIFSPIINTKSHTLNDAEVRKNLQVNWGTKLEGGASATVCTDLGWGPKMVVNSSVVRGTQVFNKQVYATVYTKGCYQPVTCNGQSVTCNNEQVISRS